MVVNGSAVPPIDLGAILIRVIIIVVSDMASIPPSFSLYVCGVDVANRSLFALFLVYIVLINN